MANENVRVLYTDLKITPEQVLLDGLHDVQEAGEGEIECVAVVIRFKKKKGNPHALHTTIISDFDPEDVYLMGRRLQQRAEEMISNAGTY